MDDDLLTVLHEQLEEAKPKLLAQRRIDAYKFLDKAYFYSSQVHRLCDPLDEWEQKLISAFNHAVDLPKQSSREQLCTQLVYAKDVMSLRLGKNPPVTETETKIFEIVDQFNMSGEVS
jgi:hypothetical protein